MDAVRVPPSAWITSQSNVTARSPSASRSTTARNERPISPYRVIWDLMHCVDRTRTVVTHDAGSPRDQITAFYEAIVPHGYIGWGKTTQLGTGLGLVQGAKLARPDWHAVNITGEAGIGMVGMDFETSVRNRIGTTTLVLRNGVMGGYTSFHPVASEKYAIHELGGNYADLASALGGYAERIEDPAEIKPAIKRALARNDEGEPALLEFITTEENRKATKEEEKQILDSDALRPGHHRAFEELHGRPIDLSIPKPALRLPHMAIFHLCRPAAT